MDENIDGGEHIEQPELSPVEQEARGQGWVPKDEFNGEEHKWVDAGEFLRRGELFGKIESQNKELKAIRETLAQFKDHHSKVQEQAYKRALQDLKDKKKEALLEGNADLVIEVDEQLADVKAQQVQLTQQASKQPEQVQHPEFVAFREANQWYDRFPTMRGWADGRGLELQAEGKSPSEILRTVAREVREQFPAKFENPNRNKAGGVEAPANRGRSAGAAAAYQPTEIEERMATRFVKEGLFKNKQEYYAELAANARS